MRLPNMCIFKESSSYRHSRILSSTTWKKVSIIINYKSGTLPETNSSHLQQWHPKRKQFSSNHQFSGTMSVSFREGKCRFCRPLQSSYSWRKTRHPWSLYLRIPAWLATEPQTQKGQPNTLPETNIFALRNGWLEYNFCIGEMLVSGRVTLDSWWFQKTTHTHMYIYIYQQKISGIKDTKGYIESQIRLKFLSFRSFY